MKSTTFTITVPDTGGGFKNLPAVFMRKVSLMTALKLQLHVQPADKANCFVLVGIGDAVPDAASSKPSPLPDAVVCDGKPLKDDARTITLGNGDRFELSQEAFCELQKCQRAGDAWHIFDRFADHICGPDRVAIWIACGSNNSPV